MNIDQAIMRAKSLSSFLCDMISLLDNAQQDVSNNEMIKVTLHKSRYNTLNHAYQVLW